MKIPKICRWYRVVPVTYKVSSAFKINQSALDYYCGFEEPDVVCVLEYQINKKFLFWWVPIKEYDYIKNFKTQDDAIIYIASHNKGKVINLIRD